MGGNIAGVLLMMYICFTWFSFPCFYIWRKLFLSTKPSKKDVWIIGVVAVPGALVGALLFLAGCVELTKVILG